MNFYIPKNLVVLLLLNALFLSTLCAQQDFIRGKLLEAKTGEPVVFATIKVKGKAKGVISNRDGSFRVPKNFKDLGDVLVISSMGYEKREMPILGLSPEHINIIRLKPGVMTLNEVVLQGKRPKRLSAAQIVRKALKAIPKNYPSTTFSSIGYYRDYQLRKEKYVNLNEAILEVIDSGFDQNDHATTKVRLYDYRSNDDFEKDFEGRFKYDYKRYQKYIDKAYLFNYGGNEFSILRIHDAIRNHEINSYDFVNVMHRDFVSNHSFKKENEIRLDDEMLYKISFTKLLVQYRIFGTIYISKKNYAIHKMEYSLYDKTRTNENKEKNKHGVNNEIIFEVISEYKRKYDKMYLNYISFFNNFQVSKPPKFVLNETVADINCECFVLTFNNSVHQGYAKEKRYYNFKFKGKKIKIDKIKINKEIVYVYPDMGRSEFITMTNELYAASRKRLEQFDILSIEVTGLRDATGEANLINKMQYKTYKQFREFFVQEIKLNGSALKDSLFMKKNAPIFKDQPIIKPDNFDDYWMNTPLQNINN